MKCSQNIMKTYECICITGSPIEVKETMARFTTDVISACAFGIDSNSLKNPNSEFRAQLRKVFEPSRSRIIKGFLSVFFPPLLKIIKIRAIDYSVTLFVRETLWSTAKYR